MMEPIVLPRDEQNMAPAVAVRTSRAISLFCIRTAFLLVLIVAINATVADRQGNSTCPSKCQCFSAFSNELDNPPTYTPLTSDQDKRYALLAVSCQREQLTSFPQGIPTATVVLFLAYNQLDHLDASMFDGLDDVRTLDVSHNKIYRIAKDTFNKMKKLQYLNIAYNEMTKLPRGFLCPWHYRNDIQSTDASECEEKEMMAESVITLNIIQNPWHCNCALQVFVENFSCKSGKSPCIEFLKDLDYIGQCHTPSRLEGTSISSLSSHDFEGSRNLCINKSHIDIPMVITMVTWFGGIIGYVIYFIRWNHTEMARQSSYLASLEKKPQPTVSSRMERHESQAETHGSQSESVYVQTSGQCQDRHQKLSFEQTPVKRHIGTPTKAYLPTPTIWVERCTTDNAADRGPSTTSNLDGEYAVSRQADFQEKSLPVRQKRRTSASSPSGPQNKVKNEEIYRMSSL